MVRDRTLLFCSANRAYALGQHRAYVGGVADKLYPAFDNIEEEAENFANEAYERFCQMPGYENGPDLGDLAEMAQDEAISRYEDLVFVKGELTGFATAGMYHLWEKILKSFIARELRHYGLTEERRREIENANFKKLKKWLTELGFDISHYPFGDQLDTSRLIANTVKHGDGYSCRQIAEKEPALLRGPNNLEIPFGEPHAEDLWIDATRFTAFADSIENFWNEIPERLPVPDSWA